MPTIQRDCNVVDRESHFLLIDILSHNQASRVALCP